MIKRIIAAIGLNLLMILFFSACDNNINGDTNTKSDANPLTNTPTPISINHAANSHKPQKVILVQQPYLHRMKPLRLHQQ